MGKKIKKVKAAVVARTTCCKTIAIGSGELIGMLRKCGVDDVPDDARVYFRVPSGGDCSGESIGLDTLRKGGDKNQQSIIIVLYEVSGDRR